MELSKITPLVLTYNEIENIERCLAELAWAAQVVVVDSLSTDGTREKASAFANVHCVPRAFDDHTTQWNYGVDLCATEWILALDADYVLGPGFAEEIRRLSPASDTDAYDARFRYVIFGKALRGSLYPPRAVLFRKDRCRYRPDGHTQLLHVPGQPGHLNSSIFHDDRKSLTRWFQSQDKYAKLEAVKLHEESHGNLSLQDRLRLAILPAPPMALLYVLVVKGAVWDGWRGWYYALQRTIAEVMLALRLLEKRFTHDSVA